MNVNLKYIKERREKMDITLIEMSELLGFKNASTYLKYENGDYLFKANMLPLLSKKLNCNIEDFFCNPDFENRNL